MFFAIVGCYTSKNYGGDFPPEGHSKRLPMVRLAAFSLVLDMIVALGMLALAIYGFATRGEYAISLAAAKALLSIGIFYAIPASIFTAVALYTKQRNFYQRTLCQAAWSGQVNRARMISD